MKIAISASNPELSSPVDPRFGRCPYFIFIDPETMKFESVENTNVTFSSGAGIQTAQFVAEKGVKAVLTGSCGPNAFQTLKASGVEVFVGITGTVQEAAKQYQSGRLQGTAQPNVSSHFGIGSSGPAAPYSGTGRGMGGGMGRGMGRGMGYMPPPQPPQSPPFNPPGAPMSPEEEVDFLKKQAGELKQQIEEIYKKIEEIEKKKD